MKWIPKLVLVVEGGVLQSVISDYPIDVLLIDYDTDGADNPVPVPQTEDQCPMLAVVTDPVVDVDPPRVRQLFNIQRSDS